MPWCIYGKDLMVPEPPHIRGKQNENEDGAHNQSTINDCLLPIAIVEHFLPKHWD